MPKVPIEDLSGGYNFKTASHLIEDSQSRLIEECTWINGRWEKRAGYTTPYDATGDTNEVIEMTDFIKKDGTVYLIAGTTEHIYRLNGTSWTEEYNGTARATTAKWFFTEFQDKLYATNGIDNPQVLDDPTTGNFGNHTTSTKSITRANVVLGFHSRLLFFNTTDGTDGNVPWRFQWSETNDPTTVETTSFLNLDNSNSPIVSAYLFRSDAIAVYKADSVWLVQDVGEPFYFQRRFGADMGIIAPKAVTRHPQGNFFVSNMGFHLFLGNGVTNVGEQREAYDHYRANVNDSKVENTYCWTDGKNHHIHIMYPTGSGDEPDEEIIWDYLRDIFFVHKVGGYCGFHQFRTVTTTVNYHGMASGVVRKRNNATGNGQTDGGTAIDTKLYSKAFRKAPTIQTGQDTWTTGDDYLQVEQVLANISPIGSSGSKLKVGEADTGDATPSYSTVARFVEETNLKAPAGYPQTDEAVGRYLTIAFEDFDYISSYDIEFTGGGQE